MNKNQFSNECRFYDDFDQFCHYLMINIDYSQIISELPTTIQTHSYFWIKRINSNHSFCTLQPRSEIIKKVTGDMQKLSDTDLSDSAVIISFIEDVKAEHGISNDFAFYVALVGLFPPKRNILKNDYGTYQSHGTHSSYSTLSS